LKNPVVVGGSPVQWLENPWQFHEVVEFDESLQDGATLLLYRQEFTLPETNIAPENGWLENYFPLGKAYFQVLC